MGSPRRLPEPHLGLSPHQPPGEAQRGQQLRRCRGTRRHSPRLASTCPNSLLHPQTPLGPESEQGSGPRGGKSFKL